MAELPVQTNDTVLVERLKRRDKSALEELLRVHGAKLYGVALQFMRNEPAAQEVMQDALINIWNKIDSFEGRSALSSWLYRLTANAALMALRKQRRQEHVVSLDEQRNNDEGIIRQLPDVTEWPSQTVVREELGERVRAAIDNLNDPYRTTVMLRDIEEFSLEEIAELTGVSVPAVKSRLHRGRLALRKVLLPYLQGQEDDAP